MKLSQSSSVLAVVLLGVGSSTAFSVGSTTHSVASPSSANRVERENISTMRRGRRLFMDQSAEGGGEEMDSSSDAETNPSVDDVTALKKEIELLEQDLKAKKSSLMYSQNQVEEYSKAGYARAVAEMENMRRVRVNMNSSSQSNAMAGILKSFIPVYDKLEMMREQYANDDFGKQYGGLWIGPTFVKMGVKEYNVAAGETLDRIKMDPIAMEYSTTFPKDTVIVQLASGMELSGNVVRPAACVISRGSEEEEAAAGAAESTPESSG